MRRLIAVTAGMAFLAALPLSHWVMAGPKPKVLLCHVNNARPHVISVSGNALPAHLAHGDCQLTAGSPGDDCTCP
jgi:hypothetical protein